MFVQLLKVVILTIITSADLHVVVSRPHSIAACDALSHWHWRKKKETTLLQKLGKHPNVYSTQT